MAALRFGYFLSSFIKQEDKKENYKAGANEANANEVKVETVSRTKILMFLFVYLCATGIVIGLAFI